MTTHQRRILEYKKEIAYLLTVKPRGQVKRILYDDHERHRKLGIGEKACDNIWLSLMSRKNPSDKVPRKRKVVVYYKWSKKLRGVYPNEKSVARSLGTSVDMVKDYIGKRFRNAIYEFKEEMR